MKIADYIVKHEQDLTVHKPELLRVHNSDADSERLLTLMAAGNMIFDDVSSQLKELIKSRNPGKKPTPEEFQELIDQHLNGCPIEAYGVWVYYPWSRRLVHILDKAEFIDLRTSANRNKISEPERDVLATKIVGVIGLSVGQSVSVTLAMERGCGELRLADFDTLELNNLNRIRTGLHNLGLLKVYSVAREISEIDPYLNVVCYPEGITDENIHQFFTEGGLLDAVIDECDGVNIKILCRLKAKELNVPVLMEASDRGTLDIERFDLEPERPIMHGWLEHLSLDLDVLKNLATNEQKLPYMLPIAGFDTLSNKMKASLLEMNVSITTWPQLATAVTLGGAITADTCRRIFLKQLTVSGRYFIDMEQLIPESTVPPSSSGRTTETLSIRNQLSTITIENSQQIDGRIFPDEGTVRQIVKESVSVANWGNLQPWHFHYNNGNLYALLQPTELKYFSDFQQNQLLGRLVVKISQASNQQNLAAELVKLDYDESYKYAVFQFKAINPQQTTDHFSNIEITQPASWSNFVTSAKDVSSKFPTLRISLHNELSKQINDIIADSERLSLLIPESHSDLFTHCLKWPGQAHDTGISVTNRYFAQQDLFPLKVVSNPDVARILANWPNGGRALQGPSRQYLSQAIGFIVVLGTVPDNATLFECGKLVQTIEAIAAKHGLQIKEWDATPTHLYNMAKHMSSLSGNIIQSLQTLKTNLSEIGVTSDSEHVLSILQVSTLAPAFTPRAQKQLDQILTFTNKA